LLVFAGLWLGFRVEIFLFVNATFGLNGGHSDFEKGLKFIWCFFFIFVVEDSRLVIDIREMIFKSRMLPNLDKGDPFVTFWIEHLLE
jgi:hypothetical protein